MAPNKPDPRIHATFTAAEDALEAGDAQQALALAGELEALLPGDPEVALLAGACLLDLGDPEEADARLEAALRLHPRHLDLIMERASVLLGWEEDEDALEEGLALAQRGLEQSRKDEDLDFQLDFLVLVASAHNTLGDARAALAVIDEARALNPVDLGARLEHAAALFELCRFDEAKVQLEALAKDAPEEAWVHHTLGCIAERARDTALAQGHFARAQALDPEAFPPPIELGEEAFDAALEAAMERLPEAARAALENTPVAVEDFPSSEDLLANEPPLSPSILGLFRGMAIPHRELLNPTDHFPATVLLYQRNLERFARTREELIEEIEVTLLHEVGHLLGLDEDDLDRRGLH